MAPITLIEELKKAREAGFREGMVAAAGIVKKQIYDDHSECLSCRRSRAISDEIAKQIKALAAASEPAVSADPTVDYRHSAGLIIDACEKELGIKIWPEDSDELSELLDRCMESIENYREIRCGASEPAKVPEVCNCYKCLKEVNDAQGIPLIFSRMVVCDICGNKRCPHATDHRHACTGSNEPGQAGSRYSEAISVREG